jgi:hypothetical protein
MERPGGYLFDFLENCHLFFLANARLHHRRRKQRDREAHIEVREQEEDTCLSYEVTETARERGTLV